MAWETKSKQTDSDVAVQLIAKIRGYQLPVFTRTIREGMTDRLARQILR